jgi:hypothetical protein
MPPKPADDGKGSKMGPGANVTMDSNAVKEWNRYEDSALRLTDPRFMAEIGERDQAAAGLGYGKKHPDRNLYYSKGPKKRDRGVGHVAGEFHDWMNKSQARLDGPMIENPYVLLKKAGNLSTSMPQREAKKVEDHRFICHPRSLEPRNDLVSFYSP